MKTLTKITQSGLKSFIGLGLIACSTQATQHKKGIAMISSKEPQIYTFESNANGFNTNTFFYDNGEEVVAFDAQFTEDLARKSIEFLRTKTSNPIRYLVITHPNPDKFNGASVFKNEGAIVISSSQTEKNIEPVHAYKKYFFVEMAKMFSHDTYPKPIGIDRVFDQNMNLQLNNGEIIQLTETQKPGVSTNQTLAYIESIHTLLVGDLVHNKVHAWLEGGIVNGTPKPSIDSWIETLKDIKSNYPSSTILIGGRGHAEPLAKSLSEQIIYLKESEKLVKSYVESLGSNSDELLGPKANLHHQKITKIFEEKFPNYKHSYMIQYGVYGLLNSF